MFTTSVAVSSVSPICVNYKCACVCVGYVHMRAGGRTAETGEGSLELELEQDVICQHELLGLLGEQCLHCATESSLQPWNSLLF